MFEQRLPEDVMLLTMSAMVPLSVAPRPLILVFVNYRSFSNSPFLFFIVVCPTGTVCHGHIVIFLLHIRTHWFIFIDGFSTGHDGLKWVLKGQISVSRCHGWSHYVIHTHLPWLDMHWKRQTTASQCKLCSVSVVCLSFVFLLTNSSSFPPDILKSYRNAHA